jgi:hypothetical protein
VASLYALLPEATFATFGDFTLRYSSLSHQYSCSRWRTEYYMMLSSATFAVFRACAIERGCERP